MYYCNFLTILPIYTQYKCTFIKYYTYIQVLNISKCILYNSVTCVTVFITVMDCYGNEFGRKHRKKTKSRWLFSAVIGDYSSEYSETTHGAPGLFITVMTIMVMNVQIVIGIRHSYDNWYIHYHNGHYGNEYSWCTMGSFAVIAYYSTE